MDPNVAVWLYNSYISMQHDTAHAITIIHSLALSQRRHQQFSEEYVDEKEAGGSLAGMERDMRNLAAASKTMHVIPERELHRINRW